MKKEDLKVGDFYTALEFGQNYCIWNIYKINKNIITIQFLESKSHFKNINEIKKIKFSINKRLYLMDFCIKRSHWIKVDIKYINFGLKDNYIKRL